MMSYAENKAKRLLQIETLLLAHPEGLTQAEIARRLNVNRSTINRYLPDLPEHIYIDDQDYGKWKIDRSADLVNVRLNIHEALALHLATRLLATRSDRQNPHAAAALRKLGLALERSAPRISTHLLISADEIDSSDQRQDPVYLGVLEKLTLGWAELRKVQIWHRNDQTHKVSEYTLEPYFIEAGAVGQSSYVIGLRHPPGEMRTLKIERIERAELLREPYSLPPDFDPRALLQDAWGIWFTDAAPVEVVLRFSPKVAGRVKESRWHRSEVVEEQADGSLVWRAWVAEPQEMLPWVRGWGAEVEVVGPEGIREVMGEEVRRMVKVYEIGR